MYSALGLNQGVSIAYSQSGANVYVTHFFESILDNILSLDVIIRLDRPSKFILVYTVNEVFKRSVYIIY